MTDETFVNNEQINDMLEDTENDLMAVQVRLQMHQNIVTTIRSVFDAQKEAHEGARRMLDDACRW